MEESITIKELLQRTADLINGVDVPVKYALQIARPLDQAVKQIESCIKACEEAENAMENNTEEVSEECPSQ